jgi:hypothetical protein
VGYPKNNDELLQRLLDDRAALYVELATLRALLRHALAEWPAAHRTSAAYVAIERHLAGPPPPPDLGDVLAS